MNSKEECIYKLIEKLSIDYLTEAITRQYYLSSRDYILKSLKEEGGVVFLFDLDDLKKVNESFGYKEGDRYLKLASKKIIKNVKDKLSIHIDSKITVKKLYNLICNDNISKDEYIKTNDSFFIRRGGDEFLLIIIGLDKKMENQLLKIKQEMEKREYVEGFNGLDNKSCYYQLRISTAFKIIEKGSNFDSERLFYSLNKELKESKNCKRFLKNVVKLQV